jgi:alkanesulfonate monooxygenase SsuD/methylene tetrahydromethanopterin reductase-like flavin-dependent oxidoreductase (luciferase family)
MRLAVNWLPMDVARTREVARRAEDAGLWGIGIGDSPHYGELYAACGEALSSTTSLVITTCATNPVTRHWSVHASALRFLLGEYPGRMRLGVGRGDSAVFTHGLRPAKLAGFEEFLVSVREAVPEAELLVAASGPATTRMAGRAADGIIAGVGREPAALDGLAALLAAERPAGAPSAEVWATLRIAIGRTRDEVTALRRRLVPRAVSASHFAFASTFEGKFVPEQYQAVMAERYATYDYSSHGRSGRTSNAELFADHPDIEDYLVDRFAVVGLVEEVRDQLADVEPHADGAFLSLLFEEAEDQLELIGRMLA